MTFKTTLAALATTVLALPAAQAQAPLEEIKVSYQPALYWALPFFFASLLATWPSSPRDFSSVDAVPSIRTAYAAPSASSAARRCAANCSYSPCAWATACLCDTLPAPTSTWRTLKLRKPSSLS